MDTNSETSPKRLTTAERKKLAVNYRIGGKTYEEIGALLKISRQAAHQLVVKALKDNAAKIAESVDELRRLELERLDFMRNALWGQVIKGDLGAVDRALKISKRMSELTGIDAPIKQEINNKGSIEIISKKVGIDLDRL
jgi:hypothetical protein